MGFNQYIHRIYPIGYDFTPEEVKGSIKLEINGKKIPIEMKDLCDIRVLVIDLDERYFVHDWFIKNRNYEPGCTCEFFIDTLEELLNSCKDALKRIKVENAAFMVKKAFGMSDLLPEIDFQNFVRHYIWEVEEVIEKLEQVIKEDKEIQKLGICPEYEYIGN